MAVARNGRMLGESARHGLRFEDLQERFSPPRISNGHRDEEKGSTVPIRRRNGEISLGEPTTGKKKLDLARSLLRRLIASEMIG